MKPLRVALLTITCALNAALVYSQNIKSLNQNSSQGNQSALKDEWTFSVNPGLGYVVNSHATPGTDAARIATNLSGKYYFGNVGLGISGGMMAGNFSNNAVTKFLSGRNYPADATVTRSNSSNSYLLFGPAVRFGKKVQFGAELSGGMFLNNTGSLIVTPQGSPRPIYSMENGDKNLFAGFSGNAHIDYPINNSTRFFISTGYLQTKSSNRILDMQQGIDFPRLQNRDLKLFTAGIGISKTFGGRKGEKSDGLSAGKIKNGGMVKGSVNVGNGYRSLESKSTGGVESLLTKLSNSRVAPKSNLSKEVSETYNPWEMDDDEEGTVMNSMIGNDGNNTSSSSSCGPVTQKTTNPDGTVTETTFACPEDAAKYNNAQGPDQFPWHVPRNRTSGEKVGNGLQPGANPGNKLFQKDTVSNNILYGKVSYWPSAAEANGIATNKSMGIGGTTAKPGGMTSSSYAAGKIGNGKFSGGPGSIRLNITADGSSKSASNKQYQLVYSDDTNTTLENADISVNPLYQSTGNSGENPMFEANYKSISSGGGDIDKDGPLDLMVSLIDPANGAVLATTKTEANGDFFFANLPTGTYAVRVEGDVTQKKGYDVNIKKKMVIAGKILSTDESWAIELNTGKGSAEQAAAYVQKTRTKSNNSNDRLMNTSNDNSGIVWSPQSNFKILPVAIGDFDSDGLLDMMIGQGASLLGGVLGGNPTSRPGNPIGGIIVKGGKNPGGSFFTTTTNSNGEFEFPHLKAGNYKITVEQNIIINDETLLQVGDDVNVETKRSFQKSVGFVDRREINPGQSNNSNGDNNEPKLKNVVGSGVDRVTVVPINDPPVSKKVVEKATSGLKDTLKTNVRVKGDPSPGKNIQQEPLPTTNQ